MKKAFTLIELLVVIAIIAILAAMLMPALGRARQEALNTRCRANMHNVGLAFALFTNDNDGVYPGWVTDDIAHEIEVDPQGYWAAKPDYTPFASPTNGDPYYQLVNGKYVSEVDLFNCPALDDYMWLGQWNGPELIGGTVADSETTSGGQYTKIVAIPEYMYDVGRVSRNSVGPRVYYGDGGEFCANWGADFYWSEMNHEGVSNLLFIDGAVISSRHIPAETNWEIDYQWQGGEPDTIREQYVPNPRMDEDSHRADRYTEIWQSPIGWMVGNTISKADLEMPNDYDDVYAIEGQSNSWGVGGWQNMWQMCSDPEADWGDGGSPSGNQDAGADCFWSNSRTATGGVPAWWTGPFWSAAAGLPAEPDWDGTNNTMWWAPGKCRAYHLGEGFSYGPGNGSGFEIWTADETASQQAKRFFPERGGFANEGRWESYDARLMAMGSFMGYNQW